jgi:hypothetical protein
MTLRHEQQEALRREHGVCANEACDACGKVLGAVRYKRRGEPGEWCSKVCRDGTGAGESRQLRRAGRPRLQLSAQIRTARRRMQIREAVRRHRLSVIKNGLQGADSMQVADAQNVPHVVKDIPAPPPVLEALR